MRLLLVEDDVLLGDGLAAGLTQAGYVVDWVQDGIAADAALSLAEYGMVVLDLMLPRRSGFDVLMAMRHRSDSTPVLVLTALDQVPDRVRALDAGADDYLIKPFELEELCARLRALRRRKAGRAEPLLRHGPLALDPAGRTVVLGDRPLLLSPKEFTLLHALLENSGKVLSRDRLGQILYGWGEEVESNAVEVHVHNLRKKLGFDLVRTVRGVGYMVEPLP
jgi:two-component system response regulator QseB